MVEFDLRAIAALEDEFTAVAFDVFFAGRRKSLSPIVADRRIRAWCGVSPMVIAKAWHLLEQFGDLRENATKQRFLWGLHLMKAYGNEESSTAAVGACDEGTFRRWAWYFIEELSYLETQAVSDLTFLLLLKYFLTSFADPLAEQIQERHW